MRKRRALAIGVLAGSLALAAAGCNRGGPGSTLPVAAADTAPACPGTWGADWRRLANKVHAPVFCPSWLPKPLNGRFAGSPFNSRAIGRDRSYLISYAWVDASSPGGVNEVHVILRGYPGRTRIPGCDATLTVAGKTVHKTIPCFDDPKGTKRFGRTVVTMYTANQGADLWHILYAWHYRGSLYSLSEHVIAPYTYEQVVANLDRMMRRLELIQPSL